MYPAGLLTGLFGSQTPPAGGKTATAVSADCLGCRAPPGQSAEVKGDPSIFRFPKTLKQTSLPV